MDKRILFGHDQEENIVSVEPLRKQNVIRIFKREDGKLSSRYEPYEWLVYVKEGEPLLDRYEHLNTTRLFGNNHYNVLIRTTDYETYLDFKYNAQDSQTPFERSQYLLQNGKTLFKGTKPEDLFVLYFDIETITTEGYDLPNAEREGDEVIIISMRTSKGDEWVLYQGSANPSVGETTAIERNSEHDLLKKFISLFREINPDVVCNHNIYGFDLPYLETRCERYGIKYALGRNGDEPVTFPTKIKFADRTRKYTNYNIFGRHVIDSQFLAEYVDVTNRDMPNYQLKSLVKYLGKASDDRVYIPGGEITDVWHGNHDKFTREDLINYALEDVREVEVLYKEWSDAHFQTTKMSPMNYQDVFRYGTGYQVEYIFMREYLRQEWSYPKNKETGKVPGGYADVLDFGLFKDEIMYIDVKSLYPTLAKILNIQPKADELGIFQDILYLLFDIKDNIDKKEYSALYNLSKILLNTMSYGFIASPWNSFSDYEEASRITLGGQEEAKNIIDLVEKDGGKVIKWDTDGGAIIIPDEYKGSKEKADEYCERLTERMKDGIIVENDGMYDGIIAFDGKSYALLEKDGTIKKKGSSIISRKMESFGRDYIDEAISILFDKEDINESKELMHEMYYDLRYHIKARELDAHEVSTRSNLKMSIEEYKNRNEAGDTPTIAQYELAFESDREYGAGDVVTFYIKEYPYVVKEVYGKPQLRKKKCRNFEAAEFIENYDYDYEPEYYLGRLDDVVKVFMVFGEEFFYDIFPDIKVYSKDRNKYNKKTGKQWTSRNLNN